MEELIEQDNSEKTQRLITIAKSVIMHYIQQNYSDKENIEQEINRINEIFDYLDISFENLIPGSPTEATNHGNGKITLRVKDKNNISWEEVYDKVETIIHEIYHSISKKEKGKGSLFLEEGYVTYITADTIRYAIENPIDIPGIESGELKKLLQKQNLENGYIEASEFVRSTQLIMKEKGIDSAYEYIFNGVDRLIEIANGISPEFGKIISLQSRKETHSPNLIAEKNFFKKEFEKINYSNVSRTLVEMNELLQTYLIDSGEIKRDNRLYQIVKEFYPTRIGWEEFYSNAKDLPDYEIIAKVYAVLPKEEINYQLQDNEVNAVKQMNDIVKMYADSSSPIKATTYGGMNFYSIMVAYDMYQKGIELPIERDILKYCNYMIYDSNSEILTKDRVLGYMDYIRTRCENGKSLKEILDENLANTTVAYINMKKIRENESSYWEKVEQTGDLIIRQNEENQEQFYYYFYAQILTLSQDYFKNGQLYDKNDYEEFVSKMKKVFDKVGMPEVTKKVGETPEMLFVKSISDNLQIFSDNCMQTIINLLDIIEEKEPNLGLATGELDDFAFNINMTYEKLKQSQNKLELNEFSNKLIVYFLNKGSRSRLREVTASEIRKGELNFIQPNRNIYDVIEKIIGTQEFWQDLKEIKEMFDKYPMIYQTISKEKEFINLLIQQLPEELQCKVKDGCPSYVYTMMIEKINEVVLGTKYPSPDKFSPEKLKDLSPLVQFILKYDVYNTLSNEGKEEEAEKLFKDGLYIVQIEDKPVLATTTVATMAKAPAVQSCQQQASEAFKGLEIPENEEVKQKNEKDIP